MSMKAYGGFAAPDIGVARKFYEETLGLEVVPVQDENGPIWLRSEGGQTLVYPKPDHTPAAFTVLNIEVSDIDATVDELAGRGVTFERYDGMDMDDRGIARHDNLAAAWLTDPAGNIVGLVQM